MSLNTTYTELQWSHRIYFELGTDKWHYKEYTTWVDLLWCVIHSFLEVFQGAPVSPAPEGSPWCQTAIVVPAALLSLPPVTELYCQFVRVGYNTHIHIACLNVLYVCVVCKRSMFPFLMLFFMLDWFLAGTSCYQLAETVLPKIVWHVSLWQTVNCPFFFLALDFTC